MHAKYSSLLSGGGLQNPVFTAREKAVEQLKNPIPAASVMSGNSLQNSVIVKGTAVVAGVVTATIVVGVVAAAVVVGVDPSKGSCVKISCVVGPAVVVGAVTDAVVVGGSFTLLEYFLKSVANLSRQIVQDRLKMEI